MLSKLCSRLSYANVMASVAVFIALGGTSYGVATGSINSRELKNNSVRSNDVRNNSLRSRDIRNGTLLNRDFRAGQLPAGPGGPAGPQGSQGSQGAQGPRGLTGAAGARGTAVAYGRVSAGGVLTHSSGNVTVTHPSTGVYCLAVTGVSDASRPILLSADVSENATSLGTATIVDAADPMTGNAHGQSIVEWERNGVGCAPGSFSVLTLAQNVTPSDNTVKIAVEDEPFAFAVP